MAERDAIIKDANFQGVVDEAQVMRQRDLHAVASIDGRTFRAVPRIGLVHLVALHLVEHHTGGKIVPIEFHDDGRRLNHRRVAECDGKREALRIGQDRELELPVGTRDLYFLHVDSLRPASLGWLGLGLRTRRRKACWR